MDALPKIREFLAGFASRGGWDKAMAHRLDAAGEETLLTLMRQEEAGERRERAGEGRERRRLRLTARKEGGGALLEFIAAAGTDNIQDRIALLETGPTEVPDERGDLASAAASHRFKGASPAVSRHRYRDHPRGRPLRFSQRVVSPRSRGT